MGFVSAARSVLPAVASPSKTGAACRHQMDMRTHRTGARAEGQKSLGDSRVDPVIRWRVQRLIAAGVQPALASRVARVRGFDIHAVLDLLDRGCPVELALRIIDPSELPAESS
jgi:hypothetical protein